MAGLVIVYHQVWWPLGIAAALGTGIIVGWVNGVVTTKLGVPSFIVTLAMLGLCTGLALQSTNGQSIYGFPNDFQQIGVAGLAGVRLPVFIAIALLVVIHFMLTRTKLGLW